MVSSRASREARARGCPPSAAPPPARLPRRMPREVPARGATGRGANPDARGAGPRPRRRRAPRRRTCSAASTWGAAEGPRGSSSTPTAEAGTQADRARGACLGPPDDSSENSASRAVPSGQPRFAGVPRYRATRGKVASVIVVRVSPRASRDGRVPRTTDRRRRYRHVGTVCDVVRSFCPRSRHFDRGVHQKCALEKQKNAKFPETRAAERERGRSAALSFKRPRTPSYRVRIASLVVASLPRAKKASSARARESAPLSFGGNVF